MSMEFVRRTYRVPAKRGARVRYSFTRGSRPKGTILWASHYLHVRFDGEKQIYRIHPSDDSLEWLSPNAGVQAGERSEPRLQRPVSSRA